ncbi:hypothetical protein [Burkholderia ambifaria]|uniref:hypothetical protein n=1 Tax=Burkholderia ambifaria TaxID=152480 RepID=UPI000F80673F|nr:hypothetical protein [Burkholderia ambifaria]
MRNLFDQYSQPENRLTHALACCLDEEPDLMRSFIQWATGEEAPRAARLRIVEQRLPGEPEPADENEAARRSLPDAWIYTDDGWALLVESKVASAVDIDQLQRHLQIASRQGFEQPRLVVLSLAPCAGNLPGEATSRTWSGLYQWVTRWKTRSAWARRLADYMEVAERRMLADLYLTEGTLTTFTGITFDEENPYSYLAAKRQLQLMIRELRRSSTLQTQLGVNLAGAGRAAITGRNGSHVWDVLTFAKANGTDFSKYPHLTLGIERDMARVQLTVPNGIDGLLRRQFADHGFHGMKAALAGYVKRASPILERDSGAKPYVLIVQRRYPSQRSEPFVDAWIEFDPRTALGPEAGNVKLQAQWLEATVNAFSKPQSNLNISFGMAFPYGKSQSVNQASFVEITEAAWLATAPILEALGVL